MAAEAEAAREARAKVIAAEGEQKASRALREASEIISDSPAALQLRYLQVLYRFINSSSFYIQTSFLPTSKKIRLLKHRLCFVCFLSLLLFRLLERD